MNAAVRALVRLGANSGHRIYGISGGFKGFIQGAVQRMRWLDVRQWGTQPGAKLKTRRDGLFTVADCMKMCLVVEKHQLDAIVMIGGWDGYVSMLDLHQKAKDYPALANLHMYCIPATISNSLPGSAQSIGADSALNTISDAISFIKHSAASSRRVYVVEVMGRRCGFLALTASLACGAEEMVLPECPLSLHTLSELVDQLKMSFTDFHHDMALVLTTDYADAQKVLTPQFISDLLLRESEGVYSGVRYSKLGHIQQGGPPTPHDRLLAIQLAIGCLRHLESNFTVASDRVRPCRVAVGTLETGETCLTPFDELVHDMDMVNRRARHQWWFERLYPYAKVLAQPAPIAQINQLEATRHRHIRSSL